MSDAPLPPKATWPRFLWKDSGWWIGGAGLGAAALSFAWPGSTDLQWPWKLVVWLLVLVATPLALLSFRHAMAVGWVLIQRAWHYPGLYEKLEHELGTSEILSKHLGGSIENWPRYEILRFHWFQEREELCLLIRRKGGTQPQIGATFWVRDTETGRPMAVSEMIELRQDGYYARITGEIDLVWLGELKAYSQGEIHPPPFMAAFLSPRRRGS